MFEFQIDVLREAAISVVVDRYLQDLQRRGYSQNSMTTYTNTFRRFLTWCNEQDLKTVLSFNEETFAAYQSHLVHQVSDHKGKPFKASTCMSHLYSLRRFCGWMLRQRIIDIDPMAKIEIASMDPPRSFTSPIH